MYAKELTKEYLQKVGITKITKDGKHIYFGKKEADQLLLNSGYLAFNIYDKEIYDILSFEKSIHINEISKKLQQPISEINSKLMMLEIDGKVIALPGNNYKKC